MLFFTERKASKELQAFGLAVSAGRKCIPSAPDTCLHSVNSCNPRRNTPNGRQVRYGSLAPAGAYFPLAVASRTGSGGLCEPREHCNTFRAVGMHFPADG